jgi:hypothetical protein
VRRENAWKCTRVRSSSYELLDVWARASCKKHIHNWMRELLFAL